MSGGGGSDTQTTTSTPWGPQGSQLMELFRAANSYFKQGTPANYDGDLVANTNRTQLAAQDQALGNVDALNSASSNAITANESLFNADDVGNNQVVQDALSGIINPLTRNFTDQVLPSLKIGGVGAGQTGSSRQGVLEALTTRDFNNSTGDLIRRTMGDFYNSGLAAKGGALDRTPALQGTINAGARTQAAVGDAQQAQTQIERDAEVFQFNESKNAELNHLMNFKNLITGGFGGNTTAPTGSQNSNQLGNAIGGGLSGFSVGGPWGAAIGALGGYLS